MNDFRNFTLYVLRHGECEHNVEGRFASHDDSPLTASGREQARSNGRLLRDLAGNDMTYLTNSITLAGGESIDVLLDASGLAPGQKFYLYTPNLDHLANDAENFGGLMTEINICPADLPNIDPQTKACAKKII